MYTYIALLLPTALNVCVCVWVLCTTFPQSLKHDGTAREQRRPDAGLSALQSQEISMMQRDERYWFQWIHLEKQNQTKKTKDG